MDFIEKKKEALKKKLKAKAIIIALSIAVPFLFFYLIVGVIYQLIMGSTNNNQSVGENAYIQEGEKTGIDLVYQVFCSNCDISQDNKNGIMGSEFMEKMSEMINLYNSLELEEERVDELDYILLASTIGYTKKMQAEIFQDYTQFGTWFDENKLTNKDMSSFPNETDITIENAQRFYKWASMSLGTPYALPDINLRGLSGNLITGKLVTECKAPTADQPGNATEEDAIKAIIEVERKLSGEEITDESWWDKILSIFDKEYTSDEEVLKDRLEEMFSGEKHKDLRPYVNLDYYDPELQCSGGSVRTHTYTKFMNYNQYKVYLETVYVPQNFINCDECLHKDSSDYNKMVMAKSVAEEIFLLAEMNRDYLKMTPIDYSRIITENEEGISKIPGMTSPLKNACTITSTYGYRGSTFHGAVDTTSSGTVPLYAVADGVVEKVTYYTNETLSYNPELGYCPDPNNSSVANYLSSGIEVYIRHEIDGTIYRSRYVHLAPNSVVVSEGQEVKQGDKIANMGNTGCSTGQHLHFELSANGQIVDPSALFSQCAGASETGVLKIETTDNFVTPGKCMVGNLTLDEIITGLIKQEASNAVQSPEFVRALAIVIRTKLMYQSDWCNEPLDVDVNINIEGNNNDLLLYSYVIDTQGMVLNYSGELLDNVDYANFPCEQLPTNWRNSGSIDKVLSTLGMSYPSEWTAEFEAEVDRAIAEYNKGCVKYTYSGNNVTVRFSTVHSDVMNTYSTELGKQNVGIITIPSSLITSTSRYGHVKFSTIAAMHLSKTRDYTRILYDFYASKTQIGSEYSGYVDISTSPGLIDAKVTLLKTLEENSE